MVIYLSNSNDIVVEDLAMDSDNSPINDANVVATILDASGNQVANGVISVPYVAGSSGNYRGTIPSTGSSAVTLTAGVSYSIVVRAVNYDWQETLFITPQQRNA